MSEARLIFQSGFADRVGVVSARIRHRRWSLRQLLIAPAAGRSLIFAGLFGNFRRRARPTRSVGKLPMTAICLAVRQSLSGETPCPQQPRTAGWRKPRPAESASLLL